MNTSAMLALRKLHWTTIFILGLLLAGCFKDDGEPPQEDPFYAGRVGEVDKTLLSGSWAIHYIEWEGQREAVPENSEECGRDFFVFDANGVYRDYVLDYEYNCSYTSSAFQWKDADGVITLNDASGGTLEMVVVEQGLSKLIFRMKFDLDEDGKDDIFELTAYPYEPLDSDYYSETFARNPYQEHLDKIRFEWQEYRGPNQFSRYEIYRSAVGCAKENATLVATLTQREINYFIDENPPAAEELCYFFRVYTAEGLLGESELRSVDTNGFPVASVQMRQPEVNGNAITLSWESYKGYYFSHYEIAARNFTSGSGYGYQEVIIDTIPERTTLSYTDTDPPYFKNPVYTVYAIDIFGNRSTQWQMGLHSWEVAYSRPELLGFTAITKVAVSKTQPLVYLYGREDNGQYSLCAYNYQTGARTVCSDVVPEIFTDMNMKIIQTSSGEELIFPQGSDFLVYDPANLALKYTLKPGISGVQEFHVTGNGTWLITDQNLIYALDHQQDQLTITDSKAHFATFQSFGAYGVLELANGRFLVGHPNEGTSREYELDGQGGLTLTRSEVPLVMSNLYYYPGLNRIVNGNDQTIIDEATFEVTGSYSFPVFTYGAGRSQGKILGSNNDPTNAFSTSYPHQKKGYFYDLITGTELSVGTKGYPHFIFEGMNGDLISISSGLLRDHLGSSVPKTDLFLERTGL
ncbi:fibronectin type III domain-containing protein [Robertkochia flava]|uniref:hypothetical protein n=1 Tax=Robertkochia flava TaxID=3447986 RepID=UPI001CCBE9E0|nr:hypothetical protein [Robertkochia marina]